MSGRGLEGLDDGGLLLGAALAEELETSLGKRVVLMMQASDGRTVERGYRIVGIYDAQGEALEKTFLFTGRAALNRALRLQPTDVTEISMRLRPNARRPSTPSPNATGLPIRASPRTSW